MNGESSMLEDEFEVIVYACGFERRGRLRAGSWLS